MKGWSIRHRIVASFGALLLLMLAMGYFAHLRLLEIVAETELADRDAISGLHASAGLRGMWMRDRLLALKLLDEADPELRRQQQKVLQASRQQHRVRLEAYAQTIHTGKDRELFEALKAADTRFDTLLAEALELSQAKRRAEAAALLHGEMARSSDVLNDRLQELIDFNRRNADVAMTDIRDHVAATDRAIVVALTLAALTAVVAGWLLLRAISQPMQRVLGVLDTIRQGDFTQRMQFDRRDEFGVLASGFNRMSDELTGLVGQVMKSGLQVNTSVTEIAATAKQQQATATEIAATTTQIGATSKEISATSRELVRTVGEVSTVADQSAALASSGQSSLAHMESTMRAVMEASASINAKLTVLNEKAGNIGQVVTTITKVADQTNLLSLNAAIEAEKAGEFGRGFAVVATEIRRLADQTAIASYDIEQMVKEIQSAVSASVMGMDKFSDEVRRGMQEVQHVSDQLTQIIQQVQALAPRFETVNEGMQAQAEGAEQISQALMQLSEAARQTVESLRQSNIAIEDLNDVASGLRGGVSRFKLQA
ncbi:methyl-accepting chemotaxis protein [Caldimonas sp. KR1-144]|uniref:methyl-accepting chemotaxis protein n=1 Tax=Caldimonas sp. KR1-144 TaxID=3400911 RepID=UPI003C09D263